jgi:SAM-dependent methyltransferase
MGAHDPLLPLACPACHTPLEPAPGGLACPRDGRSYIQAGGIWRCLLPEHAPRYARFLREYEYIRQAEGRGSQDPAYYRTLPFADLSGRDAEGWRQRARSFNRFVSWVLEKEENNRGPRLKILDLGAGNGWLSYRLAQRGHLCAALDLRAGSLDGQGAVYCYDLPITAVQAEFDRLPYPAGLFDLALFNASLHYSVCYEDTLKEACRVLAPGGKLVVLDTPLYHRASSGEVMLRERAERFNRRYGFPSNALDSEGFLTPARLAKLEAAAGLRWWALHPRFGLGWRLRPWLAFLRRGREGASFPVLVGLPGQADQL